MRFEHFDIDIIIIIIIIIINNNNNNKYPIYWTAESVQLSPETFELKSTV